MTEWITAHFVRDLESQKFPTISSEELKQGYAESHNPECNMKPSTCLCSDVDFIYAIRRYRSEISNRRGKWMLFVSSSNVDSAWNNVRELLAAGKLGLIKNFAVIFYTY